MYIFITVLFAVIVGLFIWAMKLRKKVKGLEELHNG